MDFIKRFQEWIGLKEKLDINNAKPPFFKEGEIWWTAVGENIGVEISGKDQGFSRPVLVFKKCNSRGFIGIPLSTKNKEGKWYVPLLIRKHMVTANISQIRFFSSFRLYNKHSSLDVYDYNKTKQAFDRLFCVHSPFNTEGNVGNPKNTSIVSQSDIQLSSEYTKEYMKEVKLGKWKHFKGHTVEVVAVAKNSENYDEEFVVYHHPDKDGKDQMWIRPVSMFLETIERDGKTMKRFEYLGN